MSIKYANVDNPIAFPDTSLSKEANKAIVKITKRIVGIATLLSLLWAANLFSKFIILSLQELLPFYLFIP
jgi:hypothetical protein